MGGHAILGRNASDMYDAILRLEEPPTVANVLRAGIIRPGGAQSGLKDFPLYDDDAASMKTLLAWGFIVPVNSNERTYLLPFGKLSK